MVLHHSIPKAISLIAFCTLTFAAPEESVRGGTGGAPRAPALPAPVAAATPTTAATTSGDCPAKMVQVEGDYCPDVEQTCLKWLDPPPYENLRCGEWAKPAKCKVPRVHKKFCIDRDEYTDGADEIPVVHKSWTEAKATCEARGARLCKESEWELACEGPEMSPYPYGWKRDSSICNIDRTDLGGPGEKLIDHRAKTSEFPGCVSPYGVHDMVGNVDEWAEREGQSAPYRSALRGGWWLPGRNRCRAATREHAEDYSAKQVGFRCCKD